MNTFAFVLKLESNNFKHIENKDMDLTIPPVRTFFSESCEYLHWNSVEQQKVNSGHEKMAAEQQ